MNFDDDVMVLHMYADRKIRLYVKDMGLSWPPPLQYSFCGFPFRLASLCGQTDEQREAPGHHPRHADYVAVQPPPDLKPSA